MHLVVYKGHKSKMTLSAGVILQRKRSQYGSAPIGLYNQVASRCLREEGYSPLPFLP